MNNKLNWNDYEIVLWIAEAGSLHKAAQRSRSSHPTLFRKINAIEEKLGVRLFDRFRTGYHLTAAGEEIVAAARKIEELTHDTERQVAGRDLRPSGVVRLATTDSLLFGLLSPEITSLQQQEPNITLDVSVSNELSDLSFREADIAIRPTPLPEEHLFGKRLGRIEQAIYKAHALNFDIPSQKPYADWPWVGPSTSMTYVQLHKWMRQHDCAASCVSRMDSVLSIYAAVRAGIGVAVLPCYLAEADSQLQRVGDVIDELSIDLWLLTHPDLRHTTRVRAVLDYFGDRIAARLKPVRSPEA